MARADDDCWDLASGVGATATAVAASRALANRAGLIDDAWAEPLVRAVGMEHFQELLDAPGTSDDVQRMVHGMAIRTRYFDDFLRETSHVTDIRQTVILASGLDARGYRLPWPAGTVVFEVDQPGVIDFKVSALQSLGARPTAEVRNVGVDLREDWPAALAAHGFDPGRPTAWIAEGLLIYLPPDAQDRLFDHITALSPAGSRLATEFMPAMDAFTDPRSTVTNRERTGGGGSASTTTWPGWSTSASAATSSTTSGDWAGRSVVAGSKNCSPPTDSSITTTR